MGEVGSQESTQCPVCLESATRRLFDNTSGEYINCPRCGKFYIGEKFSFLAKITGSAPDVHADKYMYLGDRDSRTRSDLSSWLRENEDRNVMLHLSFLEYDSADSHRLAFDSARAQVRTFHDRADKLLRAMARKTTHAGQRLPLGEWVDEWVALSWALNRKELLEIISYLSNERRVAPPNGFDYLDTRPDEIADGIKIEPNGWAYLETLRQIRPESRQGFVAMWFDKETIPLWREAIELAVKEAGYNAFRIDLKPHVNRIDDEIIAEIKRSRFLIADLTGHRGGVYYEAGFAQGLGLPVFWTCREDDFNRIHFDTRQFNCIKWCDDEDGREQLKKDLRWRIESVLGRGPADPEGEN